ncbi:RNA-dependent RNA polymerase [Xinzhou nematode virus 5]|uniref:RNA-directed RNA polymerase n=1 Tax=Xinzhou nematode virus 5 TaxID=1923773 RepID=A0A1L3KN90_9VIRU|nr:RNA-dependent RNA polymerase [Xinzhou nematode virus 5]APG78852.1 RNA-dependent RNA polymerase [Xinzhou nematode virus 5]
MFSVQFSSIFSPWSLGQSRTLGRALNLEESKRVLEQWRDSEFRDDPVAEEIVPNLLLRNPIVSDLWGPKLLYDLWTNRYPSPRGPHSRRIIELANENLKLQIHQLSRGNTIRVKSNRILDTFLDNGRLHSLLAVARHFRRAIEISFPAQARIKLRNNPERVKEVVQKFGKYTLTYPPLTLYFTAAAVLVDYDNCLYLCSHAHLLCYASKIDSLASYAMILPWMSETYLRPSDVEALDALISELQFSHTKYDQEFFECARIFDGLCQAYFLMTPDVDGPVNNLMLKQLLRDIRGNALISEFVDRCASILHRMSAAGLIEASSLGKCSGHPTVDFLGGLSQLKERVNNERSTDYNAVKASVRALKYQYCVNFIMKHRVWPPLIPGASTRIQQLIAIDAVPDGPRAARVNIVLDDSDWDSVNFAATREMQPLTSLLPYIRDRMISLDRDDTLSSYLHQGLRVLYEQKEALSPQERYERTALVLYVLLTRNLGDEFREFLDKIVSIPSNDLTDVLSYLIIKVVPKEGELKVKARLFGEKTFNYRLYSMLQEITAAHFLSDVFPRDQAMTSGELELKRRLHVLTTLKTPSPEYDFVHLVADISGWNNGFRQETVGPIGTVLDQLHGTTVFRKTQQLYEQSLVVSRLGNEVVGWNGQLGGIEGLNQDTWVIVYLSQMHAIFSKLPYQYYFMDMGDNFVVKLSIPKTELVKAGGPAQFAMNLSQQLAIKIRLYGHDIKPDETTCSHSAFIFCHQYRVRGIQMPSHLRKIAKMSGASDSFFPLLDNYIGCAFSNAHATAEQGYLTIGPYYCALIWSYHHLLTSRWSIGYRNRRCTYSSLPDRSLVALMLIPNILGGFPIIYLETMFLRSEADHLPQFARLVESLKSRAPDISTILALVLRQPRDPEASLITLLSDPRSLSLSKPQGPLSILRAELNGRLTRVAVNEEIAQILSTQNDLGEEVLVKSLIHNTSWPARLLSTIYNSSGFAARDSIVSCFETSRTAISFLLHTKSFHLSTPVLCRRCIRADISLNRWRRSLIMGELGSGCPAFDTECPTIIAQRVRNYHWRRKITTITTPPMGHLFRLREDGTVLPNSTYMRIRIDRPTDRIGNISDHLVSGVHEPFLGHTTSSATRSHLQFLRGKNLLLDNILNLSLAQSWSRLVDEDGSIGKLVDTLLQSYTDVKASRLQLLSGERAHGTIEHHLRGRGFNPTIAPNSFTSLLSIMTYDTRQAIAFQTGQRYAVNFLEEILYAAYQLLLELQVGRRIPHLDSTWVLLLHPCECFVPIEKLRITAKEVPGYLCLRGSLLPPEGRRQLNHSLEEAFTRVGIHGVYSSQVPTPEESAVGLTLSYWGELASTIESLSLVGKTSGPTWRDLANLQGITVPKELSLNILRRIPPERLVTVLTILNYSNIICDRGRVHQILPTTELIHLPGTSALIHLCRILNEGCMAAELSPYLVGTPRVLNSGLPPIYQVIWYKYAPRNYWTQYRSMWLPGDISYHAFIVVVRALFSSSVDISAYRVGKLDHASLKASYKEFTMNGFLVCNVKSWLPRLGIKTSVVASLLYVYRTHPTYLSDRARSSKSCYSLPALYIPISTRQEWTTLSLFHLSLKIRASLREEEDTSLTWKSPTMDPALRHLWTSPSSSASRVLYAFTALNLRMSHTTRIACLGDGIGTLSHMIACIKRKLTIFYSTLFLGPSREQAPGSLLGIHNRVRSDYMDINLRDVTKNIWAEAYIANRDLIPDIVISNAKLVTAEEHYAMVHAFGNVMSTFPTILCMLRLHAIEPTSVAKFIATMSQYASQVTFVQSPSSTFEGFLVARYGVKEKSPKFAVQESQSLVRDLVCETAHCTPRECIQWCQKHHLLNFPILNVVNPLGITCRHLHMANEAEQLLEREFVRFMTFSQSPDVANLRTLIPIISALCRRSSFVYQARGLFGSDLDALISSGPPIRTILHALANAGLMQVDTNASREDELLDIDI